MSARVTPEQRAAYNARLLAELQQDARHPRHGITGYRAGHRCDVCIAGNTSAKARQRQATAVQSDTRRTATGAP